MPYNKTQLGGRSSFGGKSSRKTTYPWGNIVGKAGTSKTRGVSGVGNKSKVRVSTTSRSKPTPDGSLWGMSYPVNQPWTWPVEGSVPNSTAPTEAQATRHNAITNFAFQRDGYAG